MVSMGRNGAKMLLRSIKGSMGRYISILAIIALGVGFFAGLKSSMPAMKTTADNYMRDQRMYDFRLMSTLGLTESDVEAFSGLEGVEYAEGGYFIDAMINAGNGDKAFQLMSLTEKVSLPLLTEGRLPEKPGECLGDSAYFSKDDIGKTIKISAENEEETLDMLRETSFIISGIAKSPRYMSGDRGSTSLGSGSLEGFIILMPEAFASEAFHEILLYCVFPGELFSDEYNSARDAMETAVKTLLNARGALRYKQLRQDADDELQEARDELDDGWEDYYDGERTAQRKLADALDALDSARKKIDDGKVQVENGWAEVYSQRASLPDAQAEIDANRALLDEKTEELEAGKRELEAGKAELEAGEVQLRLSKAALDALKSAVAGPFDLAIAALQTEKQGVEAAIDLAERSPLPNTVTLAALHAQLDDINNRIAEQEDAKSGALSLFSDQEAEIAAGEAELAAARAAISAGEEQIAAGEAEIANGRAQLADAQRQLDNAPAQLAAAEQKLRDSEKELNDGQKELDKGRREYEAEKKKAEDELAEAKQKLEDGEQELKDAAAEVEEKLKLNVYCLTRNENAACRTFENDIMIVDGISNIFPVFFAMIAGLVCITTMTRMINDERTQIGTLKALGYSPAAIMKKYLLYSGSSALLGSVFGLLLGTTAIPFIIWYTYNILYNYTTLNYYLSGLMAAACIAASVVGTVIVTVIACRKELAEKPAELMRPKAPALGRRILLERIKPLWNRLSFLSKVTLRNAFRHPVRVLMMIVGIGGCTALLVAGFGIRDSVAGVAGFQYDEIQLYDILVNYDAEETDASIFSGAEKYALIRQDTVTVRNGEKNKEVTLMSFQKSEAEGLIDLHLKGEKTAFPGEGFAAVSVKTADMLDLRPGDSIDVKFDGEAKSLTVSGIFENYLGDYLYVDSETLGEPETNAALLREDDPDRAESLAARLRSKGGVSYVSLMKSERETVEKSMASIDMVVLMLIVCSGALAFITLYNLTNINIMERTREIATVNVLGFRKKETAAYILRENLLLSAIGAVVGLVIGKFFLIAVINMVKVEYMTFDTRIAPLSYVLGFVITIIFAAIANRTMHPKLERVNMAESLKSVE